jgi:hypothetical protein
MTRPESSPEPERHEPRPHDELVEPLFAGLSGTGGSESSGPAAAEGAPPGEGAPAAGAGSGGAAGPAPASERVEAPGEEPAFFIDADDEEAARESRLARLVGMGLGALIVAFLLRLLASGS